MGTDIIGICEIAKCKQNKKALTKTFSSFNSIQEYEKLKNLYVVANGIDLKEKNGG
jgi:hypothetical protein